MASLTTPIREGGGEVISDKVDVEIIEMPNAGVKKKSNAIRDKVIWKEKVLSVQTILDSMFRGYLTDII